MTSTIFGNASPKITWMPLIGCAKIFTRPSASWCLFLTRVTRRPDLTARPLRFHTVRNYLITYAPDERPLLVVAVVGGRRNPHAL